MSTGITHIYYNNAEYKEYVNYDYNFFMENKDVEFEGGLKIYDWSDNLIASPKKFNNPIIDSLTGELREMEDHELIENGKYELQDGEYYDGQNIVKVPRPDNMLSPIWNKDLLIWEEGATPVEITRHILTIQLRAINAEIEATDLFDLGAHRRRVENNGDHIAEMDSYRDELMLMKDDTIAELDALENVKNKRAKIYQDYGVAKATIEDKPVRPSWSNKYI